MDHAPRRGRPTKRAKYDVLRADTPGEVTVKHYGITASGERTQHSQSVTLSMSEMSTPSSNPEPPAFDSEAHDGTGDLGTVHYIGERRKKKVAAPQVCLHPSTCIFESTNLSPVQIDPLIQWMPLRDEFLDTMLWLEGRGPTLGILGCPECQTPGSSGVYRCDDCFGLQSICRECCMSRHQHLPFHRIKVCSNKLPLYTYFNILK